MTQLRPPPTQPPTQPPTFYSVQDVADMFGTSRMTVYRAIRGGELAAVRIRGRWLVPAKVIESLIDAVVASSTADAAAAEAGGVR